MKQTLLFFLSLILLSSCVSSSSNKNSVEIEDLLYITKDTFKYMTKCLDSDDPKACEITDDYITKYPWLLTRDMELTNMNGMRANEWEIHVKSIVTYLDYIKNRYSEFYIKKENI